MKPVMALAFFVVLMNYQHPTLPAGCLGAFRAIAVLEAQEERRLPPGHSCVAPAKAKNKTQHACTCHKACVQAPDGSLYVQEDPKCLDFCEKSKCLCETHDCP